MTEAESGGVSLVIGLGNPGREYERTRHNAGFMVTDKLREILPGSFDQVKGFSGMYWKGRLQGRSLYVLQPETFMNLSGKSVSAMMRTLEIHPEEIMVVYDDVDLPLGRIRFRKDGSSGGHRGIDSIIGELGIMRFARLRVGIGSDERKDQIEFVLGEFTATEKPRFDRVVEVAAQALKLALYRGIGAAMNEYNGMEIKLEENNQTV